MYTQLPITEVSLLTLTQITDQIAVDYRFIFVLKGEPDFTIGMDYYHAHKGDILLLLPGQPYIINPHGNNLLLILGLDKTFINTTLHPHGFSLICNSIADNERDYSTLAAFLSKITHIWYTPNHSSHLNLYSMCYAFAYYLALYHTIPEFTTKSQTDMRTQEITTFLHKNYQKNLSLELLAKTFNLSPSYMAKYFKKQKGTTFLKYLNQIRLNHALSDLISTDLSITTISYTHGFPNPSAFNRLFKAQYNQTPSDYRQLHATSQGEEKPVISESYIIRDYQTASEYLKQFTVSSDFSIPAPQITYPERYKYSVDTRNEIPFKNVTNMFLNAGQARFIESALMRSHIRLIKSEIAFTHLRITNIFIPELISLTSDGSYNYNNIDSIIDFIQESNTYPYIELTPDGLPHTGADLDIYLNLVDAFIRHSANRHTQSMVNRWMFDISIGRSENKAAFLKRYRKLYKILRCYLKDVKIGGPGYDIFTFTSEECDLLEYMKEHQIAPDYITLKVHPYNHRKIYSSINCCPAYYTKKYFLAFHDTICHSGIKTPYLIIECSLTNQRYNVLNDTCYNAALMSELFSFFNDKVKGVAFGTISDLNMATSETNQLLFGGDGLLSAVGLKKPVFYALSYVNRLSPKLFQKGRNYFVLSMSENTYCIIAYNYAAPNQAFPDSYDALNTTFAKAGTVDMEIRLTHVNPIKYKVKRFVCNRETGSILDEWHRLGVNQYIHTTEISYLQGLSVPSQLIYYVQSESELSFHIQLLPHEVTSIVITPEF